MRRALLLLMCAGVAGADGVTLRLAAEAPDGTAWAREIRALNHDVEELTHGAVQLKWYLGAVAGDEMAVLGRIKRGQLDGEAGTLFCDQLAPSLRVTRILGLFRSHDEVLYIVNKLRPTIDKELLQHGFIGLGVGSGFGETVFFSRQPARDLGELKRARIWIWNLDEVPKVQLPAMGIQPVPMPIEDAARAFDDKKFDGFLSIPSAALAFQWSSQTRYFMDLPAGFLPACLVVSASAFDGLPLEHQRAIRDAAARFLQRFDEIGREQDARLMGGLFEKQGLQRVPVSPQFKREFDAAAEAARDKLLPQLVSPELLARVNGWLQEYRAGNK